MSRVTGVMSTPSPAVASAKYPARSDPLVMTQTRSSETRYTVPSSTISPSASRRPPYRTCPTRNPRMLLVWTRWAAASASGPRNSHLFRGETSHTPRSSRTPAYSAARSPNPSVQYHPASSMKVAPMAAAGS